VSALNDILCKIGLHQWKMKGNSHKCCAWAECSNCQKNNLNVRGKSTHLWGDWVPTEGKCEESRVCSRDNFSETRATHQLGDWQPVPDQCKETRRCSQCNYSEERKIEHTWGEWEIAEKECKENRLCIRCGQIETHTVDHDWNDWQLFEGKCQGTRVCKRCKQNETRWMEHQWTDKGICSHCGESQDKFSHLKGGIQLVEDHFSGCKLKAIVDLRSKCVCSIVVEFKNASVSRQLADSALNYWRPLLSTKGYLFPNSLTSQEWQTSKPTFSPYQEMSLSIPGHNVEGCYSNFN
jgi:hypothetical protein